MTNQPALSLDGVRVAFRDGVDERAVLDDLSLDVAGGELLVVSGRSGAGKSTLLAVAGLLRRADHGDVRIDGVSTAALNERRRSVVRRDHIAFVYQSANLLPSLTAIEQLQLVGHIRGTRPAATRAKAQALLDDLGLGERSHQLPNQLSGGERQRVGIARALMAEPDVLIADEPTASLDPTRAEGVAALLATAAHDRGIATLVVAHDEVTRRRADRHLVLADGTLVAAEAPAPGSDVGR